MRKRSKVLVVFKRGYRTLSMGVAHRSGVMNRPDEDEPAGPVCDRCDRCDRCERCDRCNR